MSRPYGSGPSVHELVVAADPDRWAAAGFRVDGDVARVGATRVRLAGERAGSGIVDWSLRGLAGRAQRGAAGPRRPPHPHDAGSAPSSRTAIRTARSGSITWSSSARASTAPRPRSSRGARPPPGPRRGAAGRRHASGLLPARRGDPRGDPATRAGRRPVDRRSPHGCGASRFTTDDLDATVAAAGDALGPARDAIQPGRRIATARREARLGSAVAFITPPPRR